MIKTRDQLLQSYDYVYSGRLYQECGGKPGQLRTKMGQFVEGMAEDMIRAAYHDLYGDNAPNIGFPRNRIALEIDPGGKYFRSLDSDTQEWIISNNCTYLLNVDKQVSIGDTVVMSVECKAYAENAMLKRILVDASIFKKAHPNACTCLFQLESSLGGDYSSPLDQKIGSCQSHALMALYENVDLHIVTLLAGERDITKPINQYPKPLTLDLLDNAIVRFKAVLEKAVTDSELHWWW